MKIRCVRFLNESSGCEQESCSWLTIGKTYSVLSLNCDWSGKLKYRLIGDDNITPALHDAQQFETISSVIPSNWIVIANSNRGFQMLPESWSRIGFWEEYFNCDSNAVEIFNKEMKIILNSE